MAIYAVAEVGIVRAKGTSRGGGGSPRTVFACVVLFSEAKATNESCVLGEDGYNIEDTASMGDFDEFRGGWRKGC